MTWFFCDCKGFLMNHSKHRCIMSRLNFVNFISTKWRLNTASVKAKLFQLMFVIGSRSSNHFIMWISFEHQFLFRFLSMVPLTPVIPLIFVYTPWKHEKARRFFWWFDPHVERASWNTFIACFSIWDFEHQQGGQCYLIRPLFETKNSRVN